MSDTPPSRSSTRLVRCDRHGLYYPFGDPGCTKCGEGGPHDAGSSASPGGESRSRMSIVFVGLAVIAAGFGGIKVLGALAGAGERVVTSQAGETRLDPELYVDAIMDLEGYLYRDAPYPDGHPARVAAAMAGIAHDIFARERQRGRFRAGEPINELAVDLPTHPNDEWPEEEIRARWEATRDEVFLPAPWYRSAELAAATYQPADPELASAARMLRSVHGDLSSQLRMWESLLSTMAEPDYPRGSTQARRLETQWTSIRGRIGGGLDAARRRLPRGQLETENRHARTAHSALRQVVANLDILISRSSVPDRSERENAVRRAKFELGTAIRHLNDIRM